jgi:uncharacterized membrane protein
VVATAPDAVTFAAMLGCGLVGGVFFAFSAFVMNALANLAPAQGIAAMQSINRSAIRPTFMIALFGTALTCAAVGVRSVIAWGQPGAAWALAGATLYLAGSIAVTVTVSVPRNDALAAVDPQAGPAAALWTKYVASWTVWNHVRAFAAIGAAALLTIALAEGS